MKSASRGLSHKQGLCHAVSVLSVLTLHSGPRLVSCARLASSRMLGQGRVRSVDLACIHRMVKCVWPVLTALFQISEHLSVPYVPQVLITE